MEHDTGRQRGNGPGKAILTVKTEPAPFQIPTNLPFAQYFNQSVMQETETMTKAPQNVEYRALAAVCALWDPRPGEDGVSGVELPLRERHPCTLSHCPRASGSDPASAETITVFCFGGDSSESLK